MILNRNGGIDLCESNAFLKTLEGENLIMEDVVLVETDGDSIRLTNIIGEVIEVKGTIEEITFLDHKIVISK